MAHFRKYSPLILSLRRIANISAPYKVSAAHSVTKTLPSGLENRSISPLNPSKLAQIAPKTPPRQPPRAPLRSQCSPHSARLHHRSHLRRPSTAQSLQYFGCGGGTKRPHVFSEMFLPVGPPPYNQEHYTTRNERYKLVEIDGVEELYDLQLNIDDPRNNLLLASLSPDAQAAYDELRAAMDDILTNITYEY